MLGSSSLPLTGYFRKNMVERGGPGMNLGAAAHSLCSRGQDSFIYIDRSVLGTSPSFVTGNVIVLVGFPFSMWKTSKYMNK